MTVSKAILEMKAASALVAKAQKCIANVEAILSPRCPADVGSEDAWDELEHTCSELQRHIDRYKESLVVEDIAEELPEFGLRREAGPPRTDGLLRWLKDCHHKDSEMDELNERTCRPCLIIQLSNANGDAFRRDFP